MTQAEYNAGIETLWDLIEVITALGKQWPGYFNDPTDVEREGCFV